MRKGILFTAVAALSIAAGATTYHVPADGALATVLGNAVDGDEIVIAHGTYSFTSVLTVSAAVTVRGGTGNPEDVILKLDSGARLMCVNNADAKVSGLVLEGGSGKGNSTTGPGRNLYVAAGIVSNCVVRGARLSNVSASGECATTICLSGANALMTHCAVTNNTISGSGNSGAAKDNLVGVHVAGGAKLSNSLIADNIDRGGRISGTNAGGVYVVSGTVKNCTVIRNCAPNVGGVWADTKNATVVNCVIADNWSVYSGSACDQINSAAAARFGHCVIGPAFPNKLFVDYKQDDLRPAPGGALHNSGTSSGIAVPGTDLAGESRVSGAAIDIGCYELDESSPTFSFSSEATEVLVPGDVAFTADVAGLPAGTSPVFRWDFDGDGTIDLETSSRAATNFYPETGFATVSLTVADSVTGEVLGSCLRPDYLRLCPRTLHVSKTGSATPPYSSWASAANSIATAVAYAMKGATIVVTNDSYGISSPIVVEKPLRICGLTGKPEDVILTRTAGARIFTVNAKGTMIDGFALQGGASSGAGNGRVISVGNLGGTVSNCVIRNCTMSGSISGNEYANIITLRGSNSLMTHCTITNIQCSVTSASGASSVCCLGVYMDNGAKLENTLIADNTDTGTRKKQDYACGVYGNGNMLNCTIVNNSGNDVGGVRLTGGKAVNCVIAGNTSTGLSAANANIYSGTQSRFTYCASDDATVFGATCQAASIGALFANPDAHDYTPAANSPLIDNGTATGVALASRDLAGAARVLGDGVDIGCYELDTTARSLSFSTDTTTLISPCDVVFTAGTSGFDNVNDLVYSWDFNGDGTVDRETTSPVATNTYTTAGTVSVSLTVFSASLGVSLSASRPDYLYMVPGTMFFSTNAIASSTFPYDSWEHAATNLQDAIDAAIDGVTVVCAPGNYVINSAVTIDKSITVRGATGRPEDVRFIRGNAARIFFLNAQEARVENILATGSFSGSGHGRVFFVSTVGGVISNCVVTRAHIQGSISGGEAAGLVCLNSANALMTHCAVTNNTALIDSVSGNSVESCLGVSLKLGARLENSLVADNVDSGTRVVKVNAGGVFVANGRLVNCTIVRNRACDIGGLRIDNGSAVNCVVAGNATSTDGYADNANDTTVSLASTCVIGGELDALFKNPGACHWTPSVSSPLFNAGTLIGISPPKTDLAGKPRVSGRSIDIGCLESQSGTGTMLFLQ